MEGTRLGRRRLIASGVASALVFACGGPLADPGPRPRRIGVITSGSIPPAGIAAFHSGMKDEGLAEGRDYALELRAAEGSTERLVPLSRELVAVPVDLIVSVTTGSTQAARSVTRSIPIVMVAAHDPVEAGVVTSLARPDGNVTGQSLVGGDLMPKQLEILGEVAPFKRIAYLTPRVPSPASGYPSVTDLFARSMRDKAAAVGVQTRVLEWSEPPELDSLIAALSAEPADAIYIVESATWFSPQQPRPIDRVVEVATRRRLPTMGGARAYAEAGLLISYGDARIGPELWRTAMRFVARILRGARPEDLPVERPTRFELVANARTASAIGVTLPKGLLDRADVVIR